MERIFTKENQRIKNIIEIQKAISVLIEQHRAEIDFLKKAFIYYDKALNQLSQEVREVKLCMKTLQEQATKR